MSATGLVRHGGAALAIRGIAAEVALSWLFVLAVGIGVIASIENASVAWRHGFGSGVLVQVLVFGSLLITRMPSSRLLMNLPQTRAETETTAWAIAFAMPVLYYAVVFGSAAAWSGWHGHTVWPALLMILDGVGLQGLLVLAWSFQPDKSGRIGWPGWTRRSATRLGVVLGMAAVALCFSTGYVPRHAAPAALAVALAAGLPAALLVSLRRSLLLKRHEATTGDTAAAAGTARGWPAFLVTMLPWIYVELAGAVLIPVLMILAEKGLPQINPVLVISPLLVAFTIPMCLLTGLRTIRLLPVSAATISVVLIGSMALGPLATCLVLAGVAAAAPSWHLAALTNVSWIMTTASVSLLFMPVALRFERLWLIAALTGVLIAGFVITLMSTMGGALPRLPLPADLVMCLAIAAGCFLWLRWEIAASRGIQLRTGANL